MSRRIRWLKADAAYCQTQGTVDRQFLFKPTEEVRNIIGSAAGRALKKYPVKLYFLDFNINHEHAGKAPLSNDPKHLENVVRFDQLFNSLVARGLNQLYGREGPLFASRSRIDEATDDKALEQQLFYAVTNPVKDGLVERAAHWNGVSSYHQLATGEPDTYRYFDWTAWHKASREKRKNRSAFWREVKVELTPLPAWEGMSPAKRQAHFRREVRRYEQSFREERERAGQGVLGPRRLAKVDPRDRPKRPRVPSNQPVCHSSSPEGANEYKESLRAYMERYRYSSDMWLRGAWEVEFPSGSIRPPPLMVSL